MLLSKLKKKRTNLIKPVIATVIGVFILSFTSVQLFKKLNQKRYVDSEIRQIEEEIKQVEEKNASLKKVVAYMGSGQFVEEQARLKFGLAKPGEEAAAIKFEDGREPEAGQESRDNGDQDLFSVKGFGNDGPEKISNPKRWLNYFIKPSNKQKL